MAQYVPVVAPSPAPVATPLAHVAVEIVLVSVGRILARAPLWARNPALARPERVRVEVASPECMRRWRARISEERAKERRRQGFGARVGPVHSENQGNSRYY